jgi:hypothetical protein
MLFIIGSAAVVLAAAMYVCNQSRASPEPEVVPNPDQILIEDFFLPICNNEPLPRK